MEAVKKLEEQWAINQRKQSNEASTSGAKHDLSDKSSTREVSMFKFTLSTNQSYCFTLAVMSISNAYLMGISGACC